MNFLHYHFYLNAGDIVEVTLDKQANVQLMDDSNFSDYKRGLRYRYHGGLVTKSPYRIAAPHSGNWNVAIDLGGDAGSVQASVRTIKV